MARIYWAVLVAAAVWLPTTAGAVAIMGQGTESCGAWSEARHHDLPNPNATAMFSWVAGHISGAAAATGVDLLASTDAGAIKGWLDKYCREHPLEKFGVAVDLLEIELTKTLPSSKAP